MRCQVFSMSAFPTRRTTDAVPTQSREVLPFRAAMARGGEPYRKEPAKRCLFALLLRHRLNVGLTQEQLAERAGLEYPRCRRPRTRRPPPSVSGHGPPAGRGAEFVRERIAAVAHLESAE